MSGLNLSTVSNEKRVKLFSVPNGFRRRADFFQPAAHGKDVKTVFSAVCRKLNTPREHGNPEFLYPAFIEDGRYFLKCTLSEISMNSEILVFVANSK